MTSPSSSKRFRMRSSSVGVKYPSLNAHSTSSISPSWSYQTDTLLLAMLTLL